MFEEKSTIPSTHVAITQHPALADTNHVEVFEAIHVTVLIDETWCGPVF